MTIEIWHGTSQKVGHLGTGQADFNVLGHISPPDHLDRLTYRLNDQPPVALSYRAFRRLEKDGDFNADIPIELLQPGSNTVVIEAVSTNGQHAAQTVTITKETGAYPLPVEINWSQVEDPQDVGQYVDGKWDLVPGGLRTLQVGYDRLFLIGETDWQDYEVTVPVTIHHVTTETGPVDSGNCLGLVLRFTGHVIGGCRNFPAAQPKWGYQPFGALPILKWQKGKPDIPPHIQFYPGDHDGAESYGMLPVTEGGTYWMKCRCETLPDAPDGSGVTRYSYKVCEYGQPEPDDWSYQKIQTSQCALRRGGLVLLAHYVDATFGNVRVHRVDVRLPKE